MTEQTAGATELLLSTIDDRRRRVDTRTLDVSLNELADMYESTELEIRPEYQRLFRWPVEKQSRFIESLILEMPIPPIFAIELEEGKWELIDGLQRVSTYLHFRGMLDAPEVSPAIAIGDALELDDCDILQELNGLTYNSLPAALQIRLKRAFLTVKLVRKETDSRYRYYMFKRLNTGGEPLSEQEVRNCTIRLLGTDFNDFIVELSRNADFRTCIESLTDDKRRQMVDAELVLRFFAFKNRFADFRHDIGEFLTSYMEQVTEKSLEFDYEEQKRSFEATFGLLANTLGGSTCMRWTGQTFGGGFLMHHFEAFSLGVAKHADKIDLTDAAQKKTAGDRLDELKKDNQLRELTTGGGKNSPGPYRDKIAFVADGVEDAL